MGYGEMEPSNSFDWAESAAQGLENLVEFIRSCPTVVRPRAELWATVIRAQSLADELNYFSCSLDGAGAGAFEDDTESEDEDAYSEEDAEDDGPVPVARSLSSYLRRMADTVDAHPEVAVLDDWGNAVHRLMGLEGGDWTSADLAPGSAQPGHRPHRGDGRRQPGQDAGRCAQGAGVRADLQQILQAQPEAA